MENEVKQVLVSDHKTAHLVPSWQGTAVLESFNKATEPLAELTDIMSGVKYITASCLNAMLQQLEKHTRNKILRTNLKIYSQINFDRTY